MKQNLLLHPGAAGAHVCQEGLSLSSSSVEILELPLSKGISFGHCKPLPNGRILSALLSPVSFLCSSFCHPCCDLRHLSTPCSTQPSLQSGWHSCGTTMPSARPGCWRLALGPLTQQVLILEPFQHLTTQGLVPSHCTSHSQAMPRSLLKMAMRLCLWQLNP